MQVRLVSHASVVISNDDVSIWTDPWTSGKAFNSSWSLLGPVAELDPIELIEIQYLWISHEHPDHFNIPTLRGLPDDFKRRVTLLFQENNSTKIFDAMQKLGFVNQIRLPHRIQVPLNGNTSVYCYQVGQMDSVLCVIADLESVLDVNDAELSRSDARIIRADVGAPSVVLNQFSVAGYSGHLNREVRLPVMAETVLEKMVANHNELGASTTVPVASFIYFSSTDNAYMNAYVNTPRMALDKFARDGCHLDVLYPGDALTVGEPRPISATLASVQKWDAVYSKVQDLPLDPTKKVPFDHIRDSFMQRSTALRKEYPLPILRALGALSVWISDLDKAVRFSISETRFEEVGLKESECDASINSQPFDFLFREPFGLQTLGVSARYTVRSSHRRWKAHRIVFALENAQVYLLPGLFFTRANLRQAVRRSRGATRQLLYQIRRMG